MRVTRRTVDTLIFEDPARNHVWFGLLFAGIGLVVLLIAWTRSGEWVLWVVGAAFALAGLKVALFARTTTHRFERHRKLITIESNGWWDSDRRELPYSAISDIVIDEIQRKGPRYQVAYLSAQGERILWLDDHSKSRDIVQEHMDIAREFLGFAKPPATGTVPFKAGVSPVRRM